MKKKSILTVILTALITFTAFGTVCSAAVLNSEITWRAPFLKKIMYISAVESSTMAEIPDIYFDEEDETWKIPDDYYATDSMRKHLLRLNDRANVGVKVSVLDQTFSLSKAEIAEMTDVTTGGIDYNSLYSWCKYIADCYGSDKTFKCYDGEIVELPQGDYDLHETFSAESLTNDVMSGLRDFEDVDLTLEADLGERHIEVDLTNQKIFWYTGTECTLSSDCVTGKVSTPTPSGTFSIKNVLGRTNLIGPTWNCWVANWAAFYNGCGLHDATWQPYFGLSRWQAGAGSHGCVNLPLDIASEMKNHMETGEAIVVFYR